MIPSLVVSDIRQALVDFLSSTFALSDDDVRDALSEFLTDNADGIFRGPYLRVRTPFKAVDEFWDSPLDWMPDWFTPYQHQAQAFDRLASGGNRQTLPTIVTTGTGSGKTECFLYPIVDHCRRERAAGRDGIKALILYPMNALATDQASRTAGLLFNDPSLAGVTAGLYIGGAGRHASMTSEYLVDQREVLRANPPDILLTNYKMLDFLLLRGEDRDLWAVNRPDTLRYVILDELHTYDGAQGTDVAMLLRRLGQTLKMAVPGRPLGIATSATLGSGPGAADELREFAGKIFGVDFDVDSIIGETRQTADEACLRPDFLLPIPPVAEVLEVGDDFEALAALFCNHADNSAVQSSDLVELGDRLLAHPLTRAVLSAVGDRSRSWPEAVDEIILRAPDWGRAAMTDRGRVDEALARYLWLLSAARRRQDDRLIPLFSIEVQLWVREVSRLLRRVDRDPTFRWNDSAAVSDDDEPLPPGTELPSVYCRRCGLSGWMAVKSEIDNRLNINPAAIYKAALENSPTQRVLLRSHPDDPLTRWYQPEDRQLIDDDEDGAVPVIVTENEDDARAERCPACGDRDAIRFLGLRVASLASVSINTLFASHHLEEEERKLLAFTDSVQDASHRAAFFSGRTHRINLRALMSRVIQAGDGMVLADVSSEVLAESATARDRYGLVPPDLLRDPRLKSVWTEQPEPDALATLVSRLSFEAHLEFGLRARVGRTLELSAAAVGEVEFDNAEATLDLIHEDIAITLGDVPEQVSERLEQYIRGLLERLRLRGAISHDLLMPYINDDGRQWFIWGGRPDGLPPFTPGQGRPTFATTAGRGDFDSLTSSGSNPTWFVDWGMRVLGVEAVQARELAARSMRLLASESMTVVEHSSKSSSIYGLDHRGIRVFDIGDGDEPAGVRCTICGSRHPTPQHRVEAWVGTTCLRYRCVGIYEPDPPREPNYYRGLYRSGIARRVVTGEHTGLLDRKTREDLESAFKDGTSPTAPNVITATPTLELGIDIGDLSAVMLTSIPPTPANYIQRVGRAGRITGNSLITAFVPTDTHGLYYLAQPEAMIVGDVRAPNCHLDAKETLERQFLAYLRDRVADLTISTDPIPGTIGAVMRSGLDSDSPLRHILDASMLDSTHVDNFIELFGSRIQQASIDHLREFAGRGIEQAVKEAVERWTSDERDPRTRGPAWAGSPTPSTKPSRKITGVAMKKRTCRACTASVRWSSAGSAPTGTSTRCRPCNVSG